MNGVISDCGCMSGVSDVLSISGVVVESQYQCSVFSDWLLSGTLWNHL